MAKVEINIVAGCLKKNEIEPAVMRRIIEELNFEAQSDSEDAEKAPPLKKQFVIIASDPDGLMPKTDFVGWVVQIPESECPSTTLDRIFRASYNYNTTKKGRLMPVKTVGEAIEAVPAKFLKEADVWLKTKIPVLVIKTDNKFPQK